MDDSRQFLLIRALDSLELRLKAGIRRMGFEPPQSIEIGDPAFSDRGADQVCQRRICLQQPSPLRNAVGLVVEPLGKELKKIRRQRCLDQFGMNSETPLIEWLPTIARFAMRTRLGVDSSMIDIRLTRSTSPGWATETRSRKRRLIS